MNREKNFFGTRKEAGFGRKWLRRMISSLTALVCLFGIWTSAGHAENAAAKARSEITSAQVDEALSKLQSSLGSLSSNDWAVFALARGGQTVTRSYLSGFDQKLMPENLQRATDYARAALVANAIGMDARKAGTRQIDLPGTLAKNPAVAAEGVHAVAFTLMALDASDYISLSDDVWDRTSLIRQLLGQRAPEGGWSHAPGASDAEITGIVLTALSPYMDRSDVRAAAESALSWLSSVQLETGGFGHPETSESAAQVLIALTSLGIDPDRDPRFVKAGKSVLARMLEFQLPDGSFSHRPGGRSDSLSTVHALLALTAADRFQNGLTGLYRGNRNGEPVKIIFYGPEGIIAQGDGNGRTAMDAVVQVLQRSKLPYLAERDPQQGVMLTSIGQYANHAYNFENTWKFIIKKEQSREWNVTDLSEFDLEDIREIAVYYGKPPALIRAVKWEPLLPRENQPITVTVELETFDQASGSVKTAPAPGVSVTIGSVKELTDHRGQAVLEGVKAGKTMLRADGAQSGVLAANETFEQPLEVDTYIKEVAVRIEGDQGRMAMGKSKGGTALEALEDFLAANKIQYDLKVAADGAEIAAIGDIAADRYGGGESWRFAAYHQDRWQKPDESLENFLLEDGMELVFYYGDTYTRIPSSVTISPARPKLGEPVTVTVRYQDWDEVKGRFGPARYLSGVQVSAAGVTAVTDAAGRANLTGLPEGVHEIEITGYSANQAPSVLRTVRHVAVAGEYPDEQSVASWAKDWVHDARAYGVLLGEGGLATGAFRPKEGVTRAEFVASLVRGLGIEPANGFGAFEDVQADAWYAREIQTAAEAGLIAGIAPGHFAPEAVLTREQAAMLLARALKLTASRNELPKDGERISAAARPAVMAVMEHGWMTAQDDGRFHPKQIVTREQAAVIAVRILTREGIGRQGP